MKVLVVGCGKVGMEIVRDLSRSDEIDSVVATDASNQSLAHVEKWPKVKTVRADLSQRRTIGQLIASSDLVCGALPGRLGFELLRETVRQKRDIVDISYTPKDPFTLHRSATASKVIVVPQCGVAPGLTNMCVGDASRRLERLTRVRIFVGGLPQKPVPPLKYRVVFSLEDVINEYTRPVHVIENGRQKIVEPLSGRGLLNFPGLGELEHFLTDGLGTLTKSFPRVRNMHELTLRYPGHAEMMNVLRKLGYFDQRELRVNGQKVEPRRLSIELLRSAFGVGAPEDLLAFLVEVEGRTRGKRVLLRYQMLDRFDKRNGVSAMSRTTAYPCTAAALLVLEKKISRKGVVSPERIAQDPELFGFVLSHLRDRGVKLSISSSNPGSSGRTLGPLASCESG